MNPTAVAAVFAAWRQAEPEPRGELYFTNNFTLLVAVVLSAQATDAGVNKATPKLFARADTPLKMIALGLADITECVKSIGLYRTKARNVLALSEQLRDRFGGEVPNERAGLESLPGVGRKTANVVLNIAFGQETMAVDTHVFRLANRMGLAPGKTVREVEDGLLARIPPPYRRHAHHWLILHGRYICKARRPECGRCLVARWCLYEPKTPPLP